MTYRVQTGVVGCTACVLVAVGVIWFMRGVARSGGGGPDLAARPQGEGRKLKASGEAVGEKRDRAIATTRPKLADAPEDQDALRHMTETTFRGKDLLEARAALEKVGQPGRQGAYGNRERTIAHQKKMQISEDELPKLAAKDLVQKVGDSSLGVMMLMARQPDGGLKQYAKSYNGVNALLAREDAASELTAEYLRMVQDVAGRPEPKDQKELIESGRFAMRFTVIESLLASDAAQAQISREGKKQLVAAVIHSLDERQAYDAKAKKPLHGQGTWEWSAILIAKCLGSMEDPDYKQWVTSKTGGPLVSRAITDEEAVELVSLGRRYAMKKESQK